MSYAAIENCSKAIKRGDDDAAQQLIAALPSKPPLNAFDAFLKPAVQYCSAETLRQLCLHWQLARIPSDIPDKHGFLTEALVSTEKDFVAKLDLLMGIGYQPLAGYKEGNDLFSVYNQRVEKRVEEIDAKAYDPDNRAFDFDGAIEFQKEELAKLRQRYPDDHVIAMLKRGLGFIKYQGHNIVLKNLTLHSLCECHLYEEMSQLKDYWRQTSLLAAVLKDGGDYEYSVNWDADISWPEGKPMPNVSEATVEDLLSIYSVYEFIEDDRNETTTEFRALCQPRVWKGAEEHFYELYQQLPKHVQIEITQGTDMEPALMIGGMQHSDRHAPHPTRSWSARMEGAQQASRQAVR